MKEVYTKPNDGRGSDTDKHQQVVVRFSDIEARMVAKLKKKYRFTSDRELFIALIKRAYMNL